MNQSRHYNSLCSAQKHAICCLGIKIDEIVREKQWTNIQLEDI